MIAAFITVFVVIILSLFINRIATIALTLTGLSREVSRFQARSALTGAGFTTTESDKMMNHPVRRRILMLLMLVGNAGIITLMGSVVLVFLNPTSDTLLSYVIVITLGALSILVLTRSKKVDRFLSRVITYSLTRWTDIQTSDSASLIYLGGDYQVSELEVGSEDWLAGKVLNELDLVDEGVLILGIQKPGGKYIGAPSASTLIEVNDVLLLYGRGESLRSLDRRRKGLRGSVAHAEAVAQQRDVVEGQKADSKESESAGI